MIISYVDRCYINIYRDINICSCSSSTMIMAMVR